MLTDPFALKSLPKWHPRRLLFVLNARLSEQKARNQFAAGGFPDRRFADLPELPRMSQLELDDTAVTPEQLQHLLACVQRTESLAGTCIVEIGAYRGVTAAALAATTERRYVMVDPFIGYGGGESDLAKMRERIRGLPNVVHERKTSGEAARHWPHGPVGMVFIDAVHDYVNVRFDLSCWREQVVPGGLMAFHDVDLPEFAGVRRAVAEACPPMELVAHVPNLVVLRQP